MSILSEFPLEGVRAGSSGSDVVVRLGTIEQSVFEIELKDAHYVEREGSVVWVTPAVTCYAWDGIGRALVRDGKEIVIETDDGINPTEFSPFITGALFGHLLHQRHQTVLHGSSVEKDGSCTVFLGDKGAGKSTLAVSMAERGFSLVTDDLVPITIDDDQVTSNSGFARAKLWPDSMESLGFDPVDFPRIMSFIEKRSVPIEELLHEDYKIARIFIIGIGDDFSIRLLSPGEAFFELNKNLYLIQYLKSTNATARDFRCCEKIVKSVPVYLLERPHEFSQIRTVSEMVAQHISRD